MRPRWYDLITINIFWISITTVAQTNALLFPLLIQRFVGPAEQGSAYGRLRLYTLMAAVLAQALMGMLSDHSKLRWGKRRPFILLGTLANILFLIGVGMSPSYWFLLGAALLSQIASNTAHAAEQGLIPDLVPEEQRGRFSGVKSLMELLPVIIVAVSVGPLIAKGHMWGGIAVAIAILFFTMLITMLVREQPPDVNSGHLDWRAFARLVAMTAVFMVIILALGEAVRGTAYLLRDISSVGLLLFLLGAIGLVAMVTAVILGVWTSVRIGVGPREVQRHPHFAWWVVNRLAFLIGTTNLGGFAIYFIQTRLGIQGEAAAGPMSQLMMVIGLLILGTALPSGWIADRIGRKSMVFLSGVLAATGATIALLAPHLSMLYVGGGLIGLGTGMFFTTNWALGTDIVPKEQAGRYLGISNLAGAGAGAIGAYIGGPLADFLTAHLPQMPGVGYMLLYGIYGALFLLSAASVIPIRETWGEKVREIQVGAPVSYQ